MSAEQVFRTIRLLGPFACALALVGAAVAWQHEMWVYLALDCFIAGAIADATANSWLVLRTIFRARPVVKVSGVDSTVWMQPPVSQDPVAAAIRHDTCPDCGIVGLIHGPCGGMSMNVFCGKCGAKFNAHGANWQNKRNVLNTFEVERL